MQPPDQRPSTWYGFGTTSNPLADHFCRLRSPSYSVAYAKVHGGREPLALLRPLFTRELHHCAARFARESVLRTGDSPLCSVDKYLNAHLNSLIPRKNCLNVLLQREFAHILEQMRHPELRSWIIMNPTSIGDTVAVCALAHDFVKQHGHAITMIVPPDHLPITQMYPSRFLRVVTADRSMMLHIMNNYLDSNRFELDIPFCGHPYDHGDCRGDELFYLYKYPGRGGISLSDLYRYILRLPWDSQLHRPAILPEWDLEAGQLAESIGMLPGKSVLLFPANSSQHPQFPDVFWLTLAARLADNGQRVFTNMRGGNFRPATMPIAGTTPVEVPVHLALSLVQLAGRTICGAHGMQFLQLLGGKFRQMTVTMPIAREFGDWQMNLRRQHSTSLMAQFMYPEVCLDQPFAEFWVPFDGTEDELKRIAVAIADESFDDSSCLKRTGSNGQSYLDEHRNWLSGLIQPVIV